MRLDFIEIITAVIDQLKGLVLIFVKALTDIPTYQNVIEIGSIFLAVERLKKRQLDVVSKTSLPSGS